MRRNGRVTSTPAVLKQTWPATSPHTSCAWRLEQVSKLLAAPPRARVEPYVPSAEAAVQDHGAVRTVGLAMSEAVTGDREDACSISAVGDNGVSSPAAAEML